MLHALSQRWIKAFLCVCKCVFTCKAYVSSAQECYKLISNETGSSSRRRCIMEINTLDHATGWRTCKHCFHCILGKCTTQHHTAVTTVLSVTLRWPISSPLPYETTNETTFSFFLRWPVSVRRSAYIICACVAPVLFVYELFSSPAMILDSWWLLSKHSPENMTMLMILFSPIFKIICQIHTPRFIPYGLNTFSLM